MNGPAGYLSSPAQAPARATRAAIDDLGHIIREIPLPLERDAIAARLTRALGGIYLVLDTGIDAPAHHEGLVDCGRALAEARAWLARAADPATLAPLTPLARALALIDRTVAVLRVAEHEVAEIQFARRASLRGGPSEPERRIVRPMRASVGVPRLHAPRREALLPGLVLDPTVELVPPRRRAARPPRPTTLEELRRDADAAREPPPPEGEPPASPIVAEVVPSVDEREVVRRLALDCLEDIAILSTLRRPNPTETWLDQAPFEQRLLDNLDAFVSLGEAALPAITLFCGAAPAPDPARGFAAGFTLGCLEGSDAADLAVALLKERDPAEHSGWSEGLTLAPSPAIDAALAELLEAPSPALAGLAVEVLGERGALPPRAVEGLLARRDPTIDLRVARALGRVGPRPHAVAHLGALVSLDAPDELFFAAAQSLLARGEGSAREHLRAALSGGASARAVRAGTLLAMGARPADLPLLLDLLRRSPEPSLARALGRFGHTGALDPLIDLLRHEDPGVVEAAAEALDRIAGPVLRERALVPWVEGGPAMREVHLVVVEPSRWAAWRSREGARLDPRVKLRAGRPFLPATIVDELEALSTPPSRRAEALLELLVATGLTTRFSPGDWVARQREHLADLRARTAALAGEPGAFWFGGAASGR